MRCSRRLVARNFFCSSRSLGDSGYTLQLIDVGASSFKSIAWSQGRRSGNFSESFSLNTFACWWYLSGTSSCHGFSSFPPRASTASCCATVVFRRVIRCQTSSPGVQPGMEHTQRGSRLFCFVPFGRIRQRFASRVDTVVESSSDALIQSTLGVLASRKG